MLITQVAHKGIITPKCCLTNTAITAATTANTQIKYSIYGQMTTRGPISWKDCHAVTMNAFPPMLHGALAGIVRERGIKADEMFQSKR